ncbi:hypothetical protein LG272_10980 [Pseudidiomarina marina]|uniref:RipA family octameric membrane protein n=1 Tax=Pseudidiomarina marina TaxID=502366 RepID=UPI00384BD159
MKIASTEYQYDICWRYFELHANQRLKTFNFFLVVQGVLFALLVEQLKADAWSASPYLSILGFSICIVAMVFGGLDNRTRELIHHAESKLIEIENAVLSEHEKSEGVFYANIFSSEDITAKVGWLTQAPKYTACFRVLFSGTFLIGFIFAFMYFLLR